MGMCPPSWENGVNPERGGTHDSDVPLSLGVLRIQREGHAMSLHLSERSMLVCCLALSLFPGGAALAMLVPAARAAGL